MCGAPSALTQRRPGTQILTRTHTGLVGNIDAGKDAVEREREREGGGNNLHLRSVKFTSDCWDYGESTYTYRVDKFLNLFVGTTSYPNVSLAIYIIKLSSI